MIDFVPDGAVWAVKCSKDSSVLFCSGPSSIQWSVALLSPDILSVLQERRVSLPDGQGACIRTIGVSSWR